MSAESKATCVRVNASLSRNGRWIALASLVMAGAVGCLTQELVRCPIDESELTKRVLAVVPVGTDRDEALRRLKSAGIEGSFGSRKSQFGQDYYCCQSWRRPSGETWRISLLLHFDKSGKLTEALELPDLSPPTVRR